MLTIEGLTGLAPLRLYVMIKIKTQSIYSLLLKIIRGLI